MAGDPAQSQVVKQLEGIQADIASGKTMPSLAQTETSKRGFQSMVNYANPEGNAAKAAAADVYRTAGETAAQKADPELAQQFMDAKKMYGQLSPVAEAGEKRAFQVQQSPTGGLGDMISYGVGGIPGVIAKKLVMPRVNSTAASSADFLAQVLTKTPEVFGKWAPALQQAASRGPVSLAVSTYVLQQQSPEFRQRMDKINSMGNGQNDNQ